nr:clp protease proteolytic subunit [Pentasachme caudatum]
MPMPMPMPMPVGVPKLLWKKPGGKNKKVNGDGSRLFHERVVFLGGKMDIELTNRVLGMLIYIVHVDEAEKKKAAEEKRKVKEKDIFLYINSPGGNLNYAIGISDYLRTPTLDGNKKPDTHTINAGLSVSVASLVLASGTSTKRLAFPHSRAMIHEPRGKLEDFGSTDGYMDYCALIRRRHTLIALYSELTGRPEESIKTLMKNKTFMCAETTREMGFVDSVGVPVQFSARERGADGDLPEEPDLLVRGRNENDNLRDDPDFLVRERDSDEDLREDRDFLVRRRESAEVLREDPDFFREADEDLAKFLVEVVASEDLLVELVEAVREEEEDQYFGEDQDFDF